MKTVKVVKVWQKFIGFCINFLWLGESDLVAEVPFSDNEQNDGGKCISEVMIF